MHGVDLQKSVAMDDSLLIRVSGHLEEWIAMPKYSVRLRVKVHLVEVG